MYGTRGLNSLHHISVFLTASFIVGSLGNPRVKIQHREVKSVVEIYDGGEAAEIPPLKNVCKIVLNELRTSIESYDLDEEYELRAKTCTFEYQDKESVTKTAIICSSVPSLYLITDDKDENIITAITVKSDVVDSFNIVPDPVTPTTIELMPKNGLENNPLAQFSDAERQNVCIKARKLGGFLFTDSYVPKPHTYEYQYHNGRAHINAMPCPSYPPTYIRLGQSKNELIVTYVRTIHEIEIVKEIRPSKYGLLVDREKMVSFHRIDDYFTGDDIQKLMNRRLLSILSPAGRKALCAVALKKLNYATDEVDTSNAADYFEFDYGRGLKIDNFAVPCFKNNDIMFLYMEKVTKDSALVKVLLHRESKILQSATTEKSMKPEKEKVQVLSLLLSQIYSKHTIPT